MKNAEYIIIAKQNYKVSETYNYGICLGKHPNEKCPQRYVTWEYTENHDTGNFSMYWGHYYEREKDAYKDYYDRLAEHYNIPF